MEKIITRLFELQDTGYKEFTARMIPNIAPDTIIGVRSPKMKQLSKEFAKDPDKMAFLNELPHKYLEENYLHASMLGTLSKDIDVILSRTELFLPFIDNWAVCDSTVSGLKIISRNTQLVEPYLLRWLDHPAPFTKRFAIVVLLNYYMEEAFRPSMLERLAQVRSTEYYVNIALAWYYSYALIKQYDASVSLFEKPVLDKWVHNKSITKAIESYRIPDDRKEKLRQLRISR